MATETRKMNDEQIAGYDLEFASPKMLDDLFALIEKRFGDRPFKHLDVGGGNGIFTGRILDRFPNCRSTLIDSAELLIRRNKPNPRKRVFCTTVQRMDQCLEDETFDLVTMNWLLHHLVLESYRDTCEFQLETLKSIRKRIKSTGCMSVYEDMINGIVSDNLASWLAYQVTAAKLIAPFVRHFGGTPAGIGVCFRPQKVWREVFGEAGYTVLHYIPYNDFALHPIKKLLLNIRSMRHALFWLEPQEERE
jgi:hypothetical protein